MCLPDGENIRRLGVSEPAPTSSSGRWCCVLNYWSVKNVRSPFSPIRHRNVRRVLLTFFKIGVANNDSFDRRVLDLSVGFGNRHSIKIECHIFDGWITFPKERSTLSIGTPPA